MSKIEYKELKQIRFRKKDEGIYSYFDYKHDGRNLMCKVKQRLRINKYYLREGKMLKKDKKDVNASFYILWARTLEGKYIWPNCGNESILEAFLDGCDYCGSKFHIDVFKKNRAFLALCIHGVCVCTNQYVGQTLGTYMYADVLGNIGIMSLQSVLSMPLMFVTLIVAPKLAKKFGLEKMIRTCLLIGCLSSVTLFAMHMLFAVPAIVHMIWISIASAFSSVSIYMQWGLVGETIDYNEYLTGKRTEGSIYGTFNLSRRIGQTIGNSAAVLMLGWIGFQEAGYDKVLGVEIPCVQTPDVANRIRLLIGAVYCVCSLVQFIMLKFVYPLSKDKVDEMNIKLGRVNEVDLFNHED